MMDNFNMDIKEAIKHCRDRKDYPDIFKDTAGLDISIPGFIVSGCWEKREMPRKITLTISSFGEISWDAIHYYGDLEAEGIYFSPEDNPDRCISCKETRSEEDKNPLAGERYNIELNRELTQEEIDSDPTRWEGYEAGDSTNCFHSIAEIIELAKQVCKARFEGNWKLVIDDFTGKYEGEFLIKDL